LTAIGFLGENQKDKSDSLNLFIYLKEGWTVVKKKSEYSLNKFKKIAAEGC
jgi:hypothetical protein